MNTQDTRYVNKEAASRSGEQIDFSFGKNWLAYVSGLEERHIVAAHRSFVESTGLTSLAGVQLPRCRVRQRTVQPCGFPSQRREGRLIRY